MASPIPLRYSRKDYDRAYRKWGANCGPSALAAVLGMTLDQAKELLPDFRKGGGTDRAMMEKALNLSGRRWWPHGVECPPYGLAIVKIAGSWPQHEAQGHWIGTAINRSGKFVFDSWALEQGGWLPVETWATRIFPKMAATFPGATGKCWISYGVEVQEKAHV